MFVSPQSQVYLLEKPRPKLNLNPEFPKLKKICKETYLYEDNCFYFTLFCKFI